MNPETYQLEVIQSLTDISEHEWSALLSPSAGPFIQYAFLQTLEECGCVGKNTGWQVAHLLLKTGSAKIIGALPLYLKQHSYGEFVFDWAWAEAYAQTGKAYYPKALCAIPFTPVQGARILIHPQEDQEAVQRILIAGLQSIVSQNDLSSAHILFSETADLPSLTAQGFMLRDSVQFHWQNQGFGNFDDFLSVLNMKRRKNIRRERAQVATENVQYRHIPGKSAKPEDWAFFYRCYANTYLEHYSTPYLSESFFQKLGERLPENLHLIIASRNGIPIASSLLFVDQQNSKAYGRYWGALEYIPCLHFETAYYQAIEYCIAEGIQTYEGGAQGQHKMARGFLPTTIQSAHWIADKPFAKAVQHFLEREHLGMTAYVDELAEHSPLKSTTVAS